MMKNLPKTAACLLSAAMLLTMASCGGAGSSKETSGTVDPFSVPTAPETAIGAESLTLDGVPLSDYVIVYASVSARFVRQMERYDVVKHGQEYDFDHVTAVTLQASIKERFGIELAVQSDSKDPAAHEILVGNTSREADDVFVSSDEDSYTVGMSEGSLCFLGGAYGTTYHSVDYFNEYLDSQTGNVNLNQDFKLTGEHHLTVIGCIGDSITEGVGSSDASIYGYPAALSRILWKDCIVIGYGCSGMTMRADTNWAYMNSSPYTGALRNAGKVDVFTIMLGTNDSRGDIVSGYGKDQAKFEEGFSKLISALHKKNSKTRFILMNCPVYYGNETYGADYIVEWQSELYEKYSKEYDLSFFDMRTFSKENMPVDLFADKLHPNDEGYMIMAEGIGNMLKEYLEEPLAKE